MSGVDEPTIVAAAMAAGHDGQAEITLHVRHANGAVRTLCLPHDAVAPALEAARIEHLDQLVGLPWTILLPT